MGLAINIVAALIIIVGVVVTALTIKDPVWKKRAILAIIILGAIHIALTIAVDDRASAAIAAAFNSVVAILSTRPAQIILTLVVGLAAGWWLKGRTALRGGATNDEFGLT